MKKYKNILLVVLTVLMGCQNYDELVKNPNLPTSSPPALLLTGALTSMNDENAWDGKQGSMSAAQFYISTYDYYGTNNYDQSPFTKSTDNFSYYFTLENIERMIIEAKNAGAGDVNPYSALGKFLKAYYFNLMSQKLGDIPLSKALKGSAGSAPVYDSQKDIYLQILKWLDESNTEMGQLISTGKAGFSGDIYLGNNLASWQKVVNAFTLRVLISLSKKQADTDLAITQKFANILGNPAKYPILTGLSDNLQAVYNLSYNPYPKNPTSQGRDAQRENVASTFLDLTTQLKDPRTFIAATPAPAQLKAGKLYTDYTAYVGAPAGLSMSDLGNNAQGGQYSYINALRYYPTFDGSTAEPAIIIGYPEMCFNIAEGINRGWATGNVSDWYVKGITASMSFYGLKDGSTITVGNNLSTVIYGTVTISVTDYLNQPSVQYKGGIAGLTQILQQKYIAFWQNSNWEAFFNQRRTSVPTYSVGAGTGNGGKVAIRWQYPVAETSSNPDNYKTAISTQFNGNDDLNGMMWILK
jgi:hypothetical protein